MAVIINRGQRAYPLGPGRILEPGASMEVSAEEAKRLLNYNDIVDASKAVPQNAQEIARLQAENARLKAEQETLRQTAPAPAAKEPPPPKAAKEPKKPEKPESKWKPQNKVKGKK